MTNIFINNRNNKDVYCLLVDSKRLYKFNGKYALYSYDIAREKEEYAKRLGEEVNIKQVYGAHTGVCTCCGCEMINSPMFKLSTMPVVVCPHCEETVQVHRYRSIDSIVSSMCDDCVDYEEIELDEELERWEE